MISVIIPSYNSGKYVIKAVESALEQAVDKEIIVVDDCSTDSSIDFLAQHFGDRLILKNEKIPRIDYDEEVDVVLCFQGRINDTELYLYRNLTNQGVATTRNIGVKLSKGDYIALLDADDWWEKNKLERQLAALEKSDAVLCNTAREIARNDGNTTGLIIHTPKRISLKNLEKTNYINCSSVLVKREVMLRFPMEHSEVHEDYLTWLRVLREYGDVVGIDEPLMKYRLSIGGKSRNKLKAAKMTYQTYCYAGYGKLKAAMMMVAYIYNGVKKYKK